MSKELFRALASGKWLITEEAAMMRLPLVYDILSSGRKAYDDDSNSPKKTPEEIREEKERAMVRVVSFDASSSSYRSLSHRINEADQNSIVVLKYHDVIIKNDDGCGNPGTEFFAEMIDAAAQNDNVSAIVLDLDTPGGDGSAVQRPSASINNARKKKPVLLYAGNGMVASAGYWIGAQCDEIYCEFNSDEVGSIGTYMTMFDYQAFLSKWYKDTKVESVYATRSTAKNKGSRDWAKSGDSTYLIKHTLDPFNEEFINAVKSGRGDKINSEEIFDGRLVMAQEALSFGLIDGMKTFAEVIERSRELSASSKNNTETQMKVLVSGKDNVIDAINAGSAATSEQITAANAELQSSNLILVSAEDHQALTNRASTAEQSLTVANEQATSSNTERQTIAAALGLTANEDGTFSNESGEVVTIASHAAAVVSQRNEYGKKAGIIAVEPSTNDEIETEETFVDPSLKYLDESGL